MTNKSVERLEKIIEEDDGKPDYCTTHKVTDINVVCKCCVATAIISDGWVHIDDIMKCFDEIQHPLVDAVAKISFRQALEKMG